MANYYYEGTDALGNIRKGSLEAIGNMEALQKLREQQIIPIRVAREGILRKLLHPARTGDREKFRIAFCKQMSLMLEAGIPIDNAVKIAVQGNSSAYQRLGEKMAESLKKGYTLSDAMKLSEGYFTPFIVAITRAGELSGNLASSLERLHRILERNHAVSEKLKRALSYPAFLTVVSMMMLVLLIHQILPVFATVFASMDAQLPWTTLMLLALGEHLQDYLMYAAIGVLLAMAVLKLCRRRKSWAIRLDRMKLAVPLLGGLCRHKEEAVFFSTLSMLIGSGIRINYGVELLRDMCSNAYLKFSYESMLIQLSQGYGLASCLRRSQIYAPMVVTLVEAGERTGELSNMLDYAGRLCQGEAESLMERLNVLAEPVIILVLGLVIGFIVMSTIMPILDLMTVF